MIPSRFTAPGRRPRIVVLLLAAAPFLSGCLWLNTLFNARKAWELAEISRDRRFRKNPLDTVQISSDEKALYLRAIAKGSKVLELWPQDSSWHPEALIVIARSQQRLSDFDMALRTYSDIVEHYPGSPRYMPAVQGEVECFLALGRYAEAAQWMQRLDSLRIDGGPAGLAWLRAQLDLGRLDTTGARRELARILSNPKAPADRRAQAAWLAGNLAWAQQDWPQARTNFLRPEILHLPYLERFRSRLLASLALDRDGFGRDAVGELRELPHKGFQRSESEITLELGRLELSHGWYTDGLKDLGRMETMLDPPETVAEGLVLLGDDARLRRIDVREALRVYLIGARVGGSSYWGLRAKALADALGDLEKLRERRIADSTRADWNFDLAELYLLRLDNRDSAVVAYRRILADTSAKRLQRARADYALAWIEDNESRDSAGSRDASGTSRVSKGENTWLSVVGEFPGTEFAKQAQRNAGVPVTTVTAEDSAEGQYRHDEILWMDQSDVPDAIAGFKELSKRRGTLAGRRALWSVAWLYDNVLHDSAKAAPAYRLVADSLPGTVWALKAAAILKGQPHDFLGGAVPTHVYEDDFVEGVEKIDTTRYRLGPRKPKSGGFLPPDVPEPIPPKPEDQFLTPDDFY
jgi:tetratricopeptide (TPR) repeat protein